MDGILIERKTSTSADINQKRKKSSDRNQIVIFDWETNDTVKVYNKTHYISKRTKIIQSERERERGREWLRDRCRWMPLSCNCNSTKRSMTNFECSTRKGKKRKRNKLRHKSSRFANAHAGIKKRNLEMPARVCVCVWGVLCTGQTHCYPIKGVLNIKLNFFFQNTLKAAYVLLCFMYSNAMVHV